MSSSPRKPSGAPQAAERGADATRRAFLRNSWVPPALWAATLLYLRPYDGWAPGRPRYCCCPASF